MWPASSAPGRALATVVVVSMIASAVRRLPGLVAALLLGGGVLAWVLVGTGRGAAEDPSIEPGPVVVPSGLADLPAAPPTLDPDAPAVDPVVHAQQVLTAHGYYVGEVDGQAGPATTAAVIAFQKVHGLQVDGAIGPATRAALDAPTNPELRGGPADRIEVDLDRQVAYYVRGGALERILHISSGSGETYDVPGGGTARSITPVGSYEVEWRVDGEREAALGILYDPLYFYGGWAIHGSNSVPTYPASHGCVRVTRADARWLFERVGVGTAVIVYGERNAFDPRYESAGTTAPAGDTAQTLPDDGIQTEEPSEEPTVEPAPSDEPEPAPSPTAPRPTPSADPEPTSPPPTTPAPSPDPDPPVAVPPDDPVVPPSPSSG